MSEQQQATLTPEQLHETPQTPGQPDKPKSSGFQRMKARHHRLISEHEALKTDYEALQIEQEALQRDVDSLLEQHRRLMSAAKQATGPQVPWFEGANLSLAQLAANPDPRAVEIFVTALAQLQSRISPIVARTPL